jgi:hypothetical protein
MKKHAGREGHSHETILIAFWQSLWSARRLHVQLKKKDDPTCSRSVKNTLTINDRLAARGLNQH